MEEGDEGGWQLGHTTAFMRDGCVAALDEALQALLNKAASNIALRVRGMIAHLFRPSSWRQETAAHAQPHESMSCTSHVCLHSSSVRSREPPE